MSNLAINNLVGSIITNNAQNEIEKELLTRELARRNYIDFVKYTFPTYDITWVHKIVAKLLDLFAKGVIKKVMISMPPQHGKSELSTRRLPAFMLGNNPDLKMAIASYSTTFARQFNSEIQRIIADDPYHNLFPGTTIAHTKYTLPTDVNYAKTKDAVEIVNHKGILKAVGRGGPLTGSPVDIMIMDDLYKDYAEGNSPVVREGVIDWYSSVVRTRLHNDSQQLIVFTRWHEDDLIGHIETKEKVIMLDKLKQLDNIDPDAWYKINFPALSTHDSLKNEFDTRTEQDEALWPKKHSAKKLKEDKELDEEKFESLHQGDPQPRTGMLYSGFNTYLTKPPIKYIKNYTDTADKGKDFLCSINYEVGIDDMIYVTDIYYTPDPQEITEPETAKFLLRNNVKHATVESNNGGRGFARNVDRLSKYQIYIEWFHQGDNKEARIISNSAEAQRKIVFPHNWTNRWPKFAKDLLRFKRNYKANAHDDAPDCLTGVLEHSGIIIGNVDALYK